MLFNLIIAIKDKVDVSNFSDKHDKPFVYLKNLMQMVYYHHKTM